MTSLTLNPLPLSLNMIDRIIDALADKLPKVAEHLEGADLAARSGPTTPRSGSTRRSVGAPTSSASFPTEAP